MQNPIHIAGIGSYQGMDQIGWLLIQQLEKSGFIYRFPEHQITLSLLDLPALFSLVDTNYKQLVLIDAITAEPGEIVCLSSRTQLARDDLISSHGLGITQAWQLLETLSANPPKITVIGIGITEPRESGTSMAAPALLVSLRPRLEHLLEHIICQNGVM